MKDSQSATVSSGVDRIIRVMFKHNALEGVVGMFEEEFATGSHLVEELTRKGPNWYEVRVTPDNAVQVLGQINVGYDDQIQNLAYQDKDPREVARGDDPSLVKN